MLRRCATAGVLATIAWPAAVRAQGSIFDRLNLDKLQIASLGVVDALSTLRRPDLVDSLEKNLADPSGHASITPSDVTHLGIEGMVRADLLSSFRSAQIRAGAMCYLGHPRGTPTGSSGTS